MPIINCLEDFETPLPLVNLCMDMFDFGANIRNEGGVRVEIIKD